MSDMSKFKVGANTYDIKDEKSRGVSLTWAQYQALSYEEQHNGTAYYITDRDAVYPVDHELNANSQNAVANDIVTPHILAMENVLGAKNVLPLDLYTIKALNSDGTWSGNTYTISGGTITVNTNENGRVTSIVANGGPFTSLVSFYLIGGSPVFESNKYILNGITGGSSATYSLTYLSPNWNWDELNDGEKLLNIDVSRVRIDIRAGATLSNVTFYPMIRPAGTDPTYVPYSMTNEQLTFHRFIKSLTSNEHGYLYPNIPASCEVASATFHNYLLLPYRTGGNWAFVVAEDDYGTGALHVAPNIGPYDFSCIYWD